MAELTNFQCRECGNWKPEREFTIREGALVFCNQKCAFIWLIKKVESINNSNTDYSMLITRIRDLEINVRRLEKDFR